MLENTGCVIFAGFHFPPAKGGYMTSSANRPQGMFAFIVIWLGQIISVLASSMSQFALTIFMYEQTGSATALGLMQVFYFIPFLLISPAAGVMIDRHNRTRAELA